MRNEKNVQEAPSAARVRASSIFCPNLNTFIVLLRKVVVKNFKSWLVVALWAGIIFSLSAVPNLHSGLSCDMLLRKTAHVVEYFILTFFLYRAMSKTFRFGQLHLSFALLSIVFLYAASDEFHQMFVHGRFPAFRDVLIDQIGVMLFFLCLYLAPRLKKS